MCQVASYRPPYSSKAVAAGADDGVADCDGVVAVDGDAAAAGVDDPTSH